MLYVTFTNNTVRGANGGVSILGTDDLQVSQQTQRIRIYNNLFDDIDGPRWDGAGRWIQAMNAATDVLIQHNTVFQSGFGMLATAAPAITPPPVPTSAQQVRWEIKDNISPFNSSAFCWIFGDFGVGCENTAITNYFPGSSWLNNVIVAGSAGAFPANNFFPSTQSAVGYTNQATGNYVLLLTSPFAAPAATDGKDIGTDFTALAAAQQGQASTPAAPGQPRLVTNPNDRRLLTVSRTGNGLGSVVGPGLNCGGDCTENYIVNTTTVIFATAATGSTFTGWSGACAGTGSSCSLLMNQARTATANFTFPGWSLAWDHDGLNLTGFELERSSPCAGSFSLIFSPTAASRAQVDSTANAGVNYGYRIRAMNSGTGSSYSNTICTP